MHTPLKNHRIPLLKDYFSERGEGVEGRSRTEGGEVVVVAGRWEERDTGRVGIILRPHLSVFSRGRVCVYVSTSLCVCLFQGLKGVLLRLSVLFEVIKMRCILQYNSSPKTYPKLALCLFFSVLKCPLFRSVPLSLSLFQPGIASVHPTHSSTDLQPAVSCTNQQAP